MPTHVLFVCSGNTCRSPMAEGLFNNMAGEKAGDKSICASSAGIYACNGEPATPFTLEVMREIGININEHRSLRLIAAMLKSADLILTMTHAQKEAINSQWPEFAKDKLFTLKEFGRQVSGQQIDNDIKDPFGGSKNEYESCLANIKGALEIIYPFITSFKRD